MSEMAHEEAEGFLRYGFVGRRLESVARGVGVWWFRFAGEVSLDPMCLWRVRRSGRVEFTSDDDRIDAAHEATRLLVGRAPTGLRLDAGSGDLVLSFEGDCTLEILVRFGGYENWALNLPNNRGLVCVGGSVTGLGPFTHASWDAVVTE